jgi:hypothetical protein
VEKERPAIGKCMIALQKHSQLMGAGMNTEHHTHG